MNTARSQRDRLPMTELLQRPAIPRALLVLVIVVSQGLVWMPREASYPPLPSAADNAHVITVVAAGQYGVASVSLDGASPVSVEAAAGQIRQQMSFAGGRPFELRLSGGVSQQQLKMVRQALVAAGSQSQVPIVVTLVEDRDALGMSDEASESTADDRSGAE